MALTHAITIVNGSSKLDGHELCVAGTRRNSAGALLLGGVAYEYDLVA